MKQPEYVKVTTTITKPVKDLAEKHNIQYSQALNAGIHFLTEHHKMFQRIQEVERRQENFEAQHRSDIRMLRNFVLSLMKEQKVEKKD